MDEKILIVEDELIVAADLQAVLEGSGFEVSGIASSYEEAIRCIGQTRPDFVFLDIFLKGSLTGIDLARKLQSENIAFIYLSANSSEQILAEAKVTQPYGFLVKPFRKKDLLITLEIAAYRHEHAQEAFVRKLDHFKVRVAQIQKDHMPWPEKLLDLCRIIQPIVPFDYIHCIVRSSNALPSNALPGNALPGNALPDNALTECLLCLRRVGFDEYQSMDAVQLGKVTGLPPSLILEMQSKAIVDTIPSIYTGDELSALCKIDPMSKLLVQAFHFQSHIVLPLLAVSGHLFSFSMFSKAGNTYNSGHLIVFAHIQKALRGFTDQLLVDLENGEALQNVAAHGGNRKKEFAGIIGNSSLLLSVFDHITVVSPADTSVLILGESGTGKEQIAWCIHSHSHRAQKPFIKINCATLPAALIESELFGHEKGAFTGATDRRIGKFEQADGGTVFLDEIGEMPIEMQAKLLRVLQEKELERLGSKTPVRVNIRVVAATNRNLEKEVAEGRFRLDLYYRLNAFPIEVPALRDRKEDILLLTAHFISQCNNKLMRDIEGVSPKTLKILEAYHWPGNIRELENVIERCVLLARGRVIDDALLPRNMKSADPASPVGRVKTIQENERNHILEVLNKCNGKIWGPGGAADLLNIPPSTLNSKMKKLNIKRIF